MVPSTGRTEIIVNGREWGVVVAEPGARYHLEWRQDGYFDLGWRKNRRTAKAAALRVIRQILPHGQ